LPRNSIGVITAVAAKATHSSAARHDSATSAAVVSPAGFAFVSVSIVSFVLFHFGNTDCATVRVAPVVRVLPLSQFTTSECSDRISHLPR